MQAQTILIIDDDNRNIFALKAVLQSKGFAIATATSAEEGIDRLKNNSAIKIVLMDMMMPDMDGYQAMAEIKNDVQLNMVKIIAVTAQAMVGDREKCLQAGADDYISKPVDVDLLLQLLQLHNP